MPSVQRVLSVTDVEAIGSAILDALSRLKHMGAISEAHVALQRICETLLRYADPLITYA